MKIKTLLLAVASFIIFNQLIHYFVLHSFNILELEGTFPASTKIYVNSSNGIHPISPNNQIRSGVRLVEGNQTLRINLSNRMISRFRMQFKDYQQQDDSDIKLQKVTLYSYFVRQPIVWSGDAIAQNFTISNNSDNSTKTIVLNQPIKTSNWFFGWIIPFFLSLCLTLLISQFNWREFPAIKDLLSNQNVRSKQNYMALDGFRGIAGLLVLLHHAGPTFHGGGSLGVWMFFVLSGFLLTKPFVTNPSSSMDLNKLSTFMSRRFKRIIPMYFFMVTCIFLLKGHYEVAIRHYLFVQGDGHFWTILQEMYFYLLLPFIALALYALCRGRSLAAIAFLVVIAILWNHYGDNELFSIYGLNSSLRAYFEIFIVGMIGAYWYHGIYQRNTTLRSYAERMQPVLSSLGIVLIVMLLYMNLSNDNIFDINFKTRKQPLAHAFICLSLILLSIIGKPTCWYKRLLANPMLRYIGIIGYSFYLIHPYSVFMTQLSIEHFLAVKYTFVGEPWRVGVIFILTLFFASFTYSFIERPFLKRTTT